MKTYVIEIRETNGGKNFWWRIKAPNGRILAHSEIYTTAAKALDTACNVIKACREGKMCVKGLHE